MMHKPHHRGHPSTSPKFVTFSRIVILSVTISVREANRNCGVEGPLPCQSCRADAGSSHDHVCSERRKHRSPRYGENSLTQSDSVNRCRVLRLHRTIRFAKSLCCAQDDYGKNHRLSGRLRNVKENTGKTGFSLPQSIYLCNPHPCIVTKIPCRETRHGLQSRRPETSSAFCLA
jgi:hypothetical protein